MTDFNPDRINLALEYLGWSKKELAARSAMPSSYISKLLTGDRPFNENMATRLSQVTGFPLSFFLLSDDTLSESQLTFRKLAKTKRSSVTRMIAEFRLLRGAVNRLQDMSNSLPDSSWLNEIAPQETPTVAEIEQLTLDLRTIWGLPSHGPINDITRSSERNGILVVPLTTPMDHGGDGVTCPTLPDSQPIIGYFRKNKPGDRLRFTIAHELGHLVLHRNRRPENSRDAEFEANIFAGALLMPKTDALETLKPTMTLNDYAHTKAKWGISIAALVSRAASLGIVDSGRERSLRIQISNRGWAMNEPIEVLPEYPILMKQVVGRTFGQLKDIRTPAVSRKAVEGFLGLPFNLVNEWCDSKLLVKDDFSLEGLSGD